MLFLDHRINNFDLFDGITRFCTQEIIILVIGV
jgi:hypothetical protein